MNVCEWIGWPQTWADWSGLGLFVFTAAQVGLALFNEKRARIERASQEARRISERSLDEKQRQREAYGALYVEFLRMSIVAASWERLDIVKHAALGFFDPSEILPRNWSDSAKQLAMLGRLTSEFGAGAYTMAERAEACALRVVQTIEIVKTGHPEWPKGVEEIMTQRQAATNVAVRQAKRAKWMANEAVRLFKDALDNSAPGQEPALYSPMVSAESAQGKLFKKLLEAGETSVTLADVASPEPPEGEAPPSDD